MAYAGGVGGSLGTYSYGGQPLNSLAGIALPSAAFSIGSNQVPFANTVAMGSGGGSPTCRSPVYAASPGHPTSSFIIHPPYASGLQPSLSMTTSSSTWVPTLDMCKVTIMGLDIHSSELDGDWVVDFSHAGSNATTTSKMGGPGRGPMWNESIEFVIHSGSDLDFKVRRVAEKDDGIFGSAATPIATGWLELPVVKDSHEQPRGRLKILVGVAQPQTPASSPGFGTSPSMTVVAPSVYTEGITMPVASMPSYREVTAGQTTAAPVEVAMMYGSPARSSTYGAVQPPTSVPSPTRAVNWPVSGGSFALPFDGSSTVGATPAASCSDTTCMATVEAWDHDALAQHGTSWMVKIWYGGQEASTQPHQCKGTAVEWHESIEFPLTGGSDVTFQMLDSRDEVFGSAMMQIVPGYWELHLVDKLAAPRGKLKVVIRTYHGPPMGAPRSQAPVPVVHGGGPCPTSFNVAPGSYPVMAGPAASPMQVYQQPPVYYTSAQAGSAAAPMQVAYQQPPAQYTSAQVYQQPPLYYTSAQAPMAPAPYPQARPP